MSEFRVPRSRAHLTHRSMRQALLQAIESVLFEPHALDNVALRPLEAQFAQRVQQNYAYGVNSGTAGLFLALAACNIGAGDEVITVSNSDISTTAVISHCGATPVLCDVLLADHTIDPTLVEALITKHTAAILPVDLYGHPADVKGLRQIADKYGLNIIEDATLATGACDYGQPVGAFADVAVFSFGAYKPMGSVGNGGMVVTNNAEIAERLYLLRSYGRSRANVPGQALLMEHLVEGYNLPLDPLEAAIVSVKLPFLEQWTENRRRIADLYQQGLKRLEVGLPTFRQDAQPTFYSYVIRVKDRDRIFQGLRLQGVEVGLHYVPPVYRQPVYQDRDWKPANLPVTDRLAEELLGLPTAPELLNTEVEHVVESLGKLLERKPR